MKGRYSKLLRPTDRLIALASPRRENPVFLLLVRRWHSHLHGAADPILWASVGLAVLSALIVPAQLFSFFIWHAVLYGHVLWPAVRFPYDLRRGGGAADDLLVTPIRPGRYVQALRSLFWLGALYAAVPYGVYWITLFAVKAYAAPGLFAGWPDAAVLASAGLYFAALSSLLWFTCWCAAAGKWWMALPAVTAPLAFLLYAADAGRLYGTEPFPVTPGFWVAALNLFAFGHLIGVALGRARENPFLHR